MEGGHCRLEVMEALEMLEVMRCVQLCTLEAVEGELRLLEALEVSEMMRCVYSVCWRLWRCEALFVGGVRGAGGAGGDALCAALYMEAVEGGSVW